MSKTDDGMPDAEGLRQRAERRIAAQTAAGTGGPMDEKRLLHELQVHQTELEMQNEALLETRQAAEDALERYTELFDFAPIAYFTLRPDGVIRQTNFRGGSLLGMNRACVSGQSFADNVSPAHRPAFKRFLDAVFADEGVQACEISLRTGENDVWARIEASADSSRSSCLAAVWDISERKRNEQALQLAATVYLALGEAIMVADANNRIAAINPAFSALTGYTEQDAIGHTTSLLKSGRHDKHFYQDMWAMLKTTGRWQGEIWNRRKNGEVFLQWLVISTVYDGNGEVIQRIGMFSDITDKKHAEEIIQRQANIDPLTELPNRRLFFDRLQRAIDKSHRAHRKLALLFLDLDHFKDVNDTLGHEVGDSLLQEAAQRLKGCIRETDTLARPGGDEFTIVMGELDELNSVGRVAQCILNAMETPFRLENETCYVSISIGITVYPDDSIVMEELLKKADQAMYAAKHQGRNRFCYFTPAMQAAAENRLRLANDLRHALAGGQLWLAYQPIVDLATGGIQKAEALIRWRHPARGLISPADFIPIAEDTGMIVEIGEWIFRQAVAQVQDWRANLHPCFQISVNKSPVQFHHSGECHNGWSEYLQDLNLPGNSIVVEITEGLLLDASPFVSEKLLAFRAAGIQVSLDDFGTGYSSMSYLKKFEIDYLKIDRSFVCNLTAGSTDMALCEAMIVLAHKLGMKVIAEGMETQAQRDLLMQAGCDFGQGYLFSEPVSAQAFEEVFHRRHFGHRGL